MYDTEWHEEKIDRHLLAVAAVPFGISFLDDALIKLLPNELMLIGARTGRGKTELATTLAFQFSDMGKSVAFFALEADKWEIHRRLKYRRVNQLIRKHYGDKVKPMRFREWLLNGYDKDMDSIDRAADQELKLGSFGLRVVYKGERYTPKNFVADLTAMEADTDVFIVDHLHYFDLGNNNEMDGLKDAIHAIRNASIHHGKPVILLAHLRKSDRSSKKLMPDLDDFHGHSDIVKVATTVLLMAPVPDDKADPSMGVFPTYFHLAKCRTAAEVTPYCAVMGFDQLANNYSDKYYLCKSSFMDDPTVIEKASEIPKWAKRAVRPCEPMMAAPKPYTERGEKE